MDKPTSKQPIGSSDQTTADAHVVPDGLTPCVWMEAGLLTWWICDRDLQCSNCPLDAALRRANLEEHRPTTSIAPDPAPRAQAAWKRLVNRRLDPLDGRASYTRSHVWVRQEPNDLVRIGLDSFAAWVVGRVRCVILVSAGTRLARGDPCAWLDQPGGTLTVTSPVSADVVETNRALSQHGNLELDDPFGSQWLLRLRPWRLRTELRKLTHATDFEPLVAEHSRLWRRLLRKAVRAGAPRSGPTLADGGRFVVDLDELLGARRHNRIAAGFLRG